MITFSTSLMDALDDWDERVDLEKRSLREEERGIVFTDARCCKRLKYLTEVLCVSFVDLVPDEVLLFLFRTFPRAELLRLGKHPSQYLDVLFDAWNPDLTVWAATLYQFTGKTCGFFANVFYANSGLRSPELTLADVGEALFYNLPRTSVGGSFITEDALRNVAASFVRHPRLNNLARVHEEDIYFLTINVPPETIGMVCRRLLLFKARPKSCQCGYTPGEAECRCQLDLEMDPDKEYAFVLFNLILERHREEKEDQNGLKAMKWSPHDEALFLNKACDVVFSEGTYKELYQNLGLARRKASGSEEPVLPLNSPRSLTQHELHGNFNRSVDNDYGNAVTQHGGCSHKNCKRIAKKDCQNVSCKVHCESLGRLDCRVHRVQGSTGLQLDPHPLAKYVSDFVKKTPAPGHRRRSRKRRR